MNIPKSIFKGFTVFLLLFLYCKNITAQELLGTINTGKKSGFLYKGYTSGTQNQLLLYRRDSGTLVKVYDENLALIKEVATPHKFDQGELYYRSFNGINIIYKAGKGNKEAFYSLDQETPLVSFENSTDGINRKSSTKRALGKVSRDLTPLYFATNDNKVIIGRKDGKEHFKENYKETEVFIFMQDLKTKEQKVIPIEQSELVNFYGSSQKVAYANDDFFVIMFNKTFRTEKHAYVASYYNYEGKLLKSFRMSILAPENSESFGYMSLASNSFNTTQSTWYDSSTMRYEKGVKMVMPGPSSQATWFYSPQADTFYLYASILNKKADDGFLVLKYSNEGVLEWEHYETIEDAKFTIGKSINRFIDIVETPYFTGFRVYSVKGKHDDHYYLFDTDSGEILKEEHWEKNKFEDENYPNSFAALMAIHSNTFREYMANFKKSTDQDHFKNGFFTKEGFVLGAANKKETQYSYYKFMY